jgi:LmbE family N-acetylglucosaminyl deacetylase
MEHQKRLLISLAHPDDESFGLGGLIAKYVDEGVEVYYLCATNGDVGTVSTEHMNGYNSIAELRLAELACASEILGFKDVVMLNYEDSGMMNTQTNQYPESLWYNWNHNRSAVLQKVVNVIRQVRPQVVITFNRYGGYGHPDHIAIQQATTQAFQLAGNSEYPASELPAYQPQKLYYTGINKMYLWLGIWRARLNRQNPRQLGRNNDVDLLAIRDQVEPTHTHIDISDYLDVWAKASACHASQGGGTGGFVPHWLRRMLSREQRLTRVIPVPKKDRVDEYDLFDGVEYSDEQQAILS